MPSSNVLFSTNEIRQVEREVQNDFPEGTLMRRAGAAGAQFAVSLLQTDPAASNILILVGPGNNGGDALEVAYQLANTRTTTTTSSTANAKWHVSILLCAGLAKLSSDARQSLLRAQSTPVHFIDISNWKEIQSTQWNLIVDGLFGIGLTRPMTDDLVSIIGTVNDITCPILALDVPSGLDADTGNVVGENHSAIKATHTITFIGNKPGLHTANGRDHAGKVHVEFLDIEDRYFPPAHVEMNNTLLFSPFLHKRVQNSHKGSYGDVSIVGGSPGMTGAAILSARTAAKCGAGRVFCTFLGDPPAYDNAQPELMCRSAYQHDFSSGTIVIGPGLGTSSNAHDALVRCLTTESPLVLDADALNMIANDTNLQLKLADRAKPALMTPHPLEAARLLQISSQQIQADRLSAARKLSDRFNCTVVLKGSGTVIATPGKRLIINPTGNAGLATAGTGDVLAGICGALLAQGWNVHEAALGATWLHGHAADLLVVQGIGPIGLTATELIPVVRSSLNRLIGEYASSRQ